MAIHNDQCHDEESDIYLEEKRCAWVKEEEEEEEEEEERQCGTTYHNDEHHRCYEGPNEVSVIPQPAAGVKDDLIHSSCNN